MRPSQSPHGVMLYQILIWWTLMSQCSTSFTKSTLVYLRSAKSVIAGRFATCTSWCIEDSRAVLPLGRPWPVLSHFMQIWYFTNLRSSDVRGYSRKLETFCVECRTANYQKAFGVNKNVEVACFIPYYHCNHPVNYWYIVTNFINLYKMPQIHSRFSSSECTHRDLWEIRILSYLFVSTWLESITNFPSFKGLF